MTYCVGMLINAGLVMMADTRTNAGVDNISCYRKLHIYDGGDDCFISIATAGNLSVTQATLSKLAEGIPNPETGEIETLWNAPSIFKAVRLVGSVLRDSRHEAEHGMEAEGVSFGATMLLGGRIGPEPLRLFMIYDAGNAIECHADTPYLQIGEYKYGKPILDRALDIATPLNEAVKLGLISFDSTMRSNLAVGLPIDMVTVRADRNCEPEYFRIDKDDSYFKELSRQWGEKLREAQAAIPRPPFIRNKGQPVS
jgi:putative proteasome-type protease